MFVLASNYLAIMRECAGPSTRGVSSRESGGPVLGRMPWLSPTSSRTQKDFMESSLTVNQLVTELVKSPHGNLKEYGLTAQRAVQEDPFLFHHLIAWNEKKGQIRDAKVALPVYGLKTVDTELRENSLAHLALLDPRNLLRAVKFAKEVPNGGFRSIVRMVKQYLEVRAANPEWAERVILQHGESIKSLYAMLHLKPPVHVKQMLSWGEGMKPRPGSVLDILGKLKTMSPVEAAGHVMLHKIPFLIAVGALPKIKGNTEALIALIQGMSPTELVSNTKMLEQLGMKGNDAVQAAYRKAVEGIKKDSRKGQNLFKASAAADKASDVVVQKVLREVQEKQFSAKGIEGNWAVLIDRSGSMYQAIEIGQMVGAALAKMVKDKVWLVFFNTSPMVYEVTGKTLEEIQKITRGIVATGGTSIGCGLEAMIGKPVDGIAVVSDGGENVIPIFAEVHKRRFEGVPVYFYQVQGDSNVFSGSCNVMGVPLSEFDLRDATGLDYYSVAILVQTMRTNRYGLYQEIMDTPLLTLARVFKTEEREEVYA